MKLQKDNLIRLLFYVAILVIFTVFYVFFDRKHASLTDYFYQQMVLGWLLGIAGTLTTYLLQKTYKKPFKSLDFSQKRHIVYAIFIGLVGFSIAIWSVIKLMF